MTEEHDHTSGVKAYLYCPYMYYLSERLGGFGVEPKKKNLNFVFGSAVHHGMYCHNLNLCAGNEALEPLISAKVYFENSAYPCNEKDKPNVDKLLAGIAGSVSALMSIDRESGDPEKSFYNSDLNFYGTADKVCGKTLYEYKTAASIDSTSVKSIPYLIQDNIYASLLDLNSVRHIIVKKSGLRLKKNERISELQTRILLDYFNSDKSLVMDETFEVSPKTKGETIYRLKAILDTIRSTKVFFKNTDNCEGRYGLCSYFDLCHHNISLAFKKRNEPEPVRVHREKTMNRKIYYMESVKND